VLVFSRDVTKGKGVDWEMWSLKRAPELSDLVLQALRERCSGGWAFGFSDNYCLHCLGVDALVSLCRRHCNTYSGASASLNSSFGIRLKNHLSHK
jgi:hypothetical protein